MSLRTPANLVSPRARRYWTVRALLGWLGVALAELVIWPRPSGLTGGLAWVGVVTVLLAAAHLVVMPRWRYRVHRWEATPTAVYTQSGWFAQERRIAPVARIQTVDTKRGPIEQVFGLSNVTVTTASAAGALQIHGLERDTADRLAAELTALTEAAGGDGT
jgi:membrane protein YdbS with pleckstrin-like domain